MRAEKTEYILKKMKERDIPEMIKRNIFPILEKNKDRVQFVKNFVGLRDILYMEEEEIYFYEYPYFLSLDCESNIDEKMSLIDYYGMVYENSIMDINEIINNLNTFFSETNRILYVDVAFKENVLTNDQMWEVFHLMEKERDKEPYEFMVTMYEYPEWYDVPSGPGLLALDKSIELIKQLERKSLQEEIINLKSKIDDLLLKDDFTKIKKVNKKIEHLQKQLQMN